MISDSYIFSLFLLHVLSLFPSTSLILYIFFHILHWGSNHSAFPYFPRRYTQNSLFPFLSFLPNTSINPFIMPASDIISKLTESPKKRLLNIRQRISHHLDRRDKPSALKESAGVEQAEEAPKHDSPPTQIPNRDTRGPPDVSPRTRVIAVLGVDEPSSNDNFASPSLGDGWMISDFYLWMHVLAGMGKTQEWMTCLEPAYLVNKYCLEDKTTMEKYEEDELKPVQTRWSTGFVHGDPFEDRVVVLDEELLPSVQRKVTVAPHGIELRDFFLGRLESTLASAEAAGDPVLMMAFAHGDYDRGGLVLGGDPTCAEHASDTLDRDKVASVLAKHPTVKMSMFMTSCFSGHWVETTAFRGQQMTVLAAAKSDEESFGFAWSHSQRHGGGVFSAATLSELLNEPIEMPPDANTDTSREYMELTTAILAEMLRLCLPVNIPAYGSTPVFTDAEGKTEKFWKRTGYELHNYMRNYQKLRKIAASDPHPKRNRKKFDANFIDDKDPDVVAWHERHPGVFDPEFPEATAGYGGSRRGLDSKSNLKFLIRAFLNTRPGPEEQDHRLMLRAIRAFINGRMDSQRQLILRQQIIGRLHLNECANQYAHALELCDMPPIEKWTPDDSVNSGMEQFETFRLWTRLVVDSHLLPAEKLPGPYYRKPAQYLAWAMIKAEKNEAELKEALEAIWKMRYEGKFTDIAAAASMKSENFTQSVSRLRTLLKESWHRSRSQRPTSSRPSISSIIWT